MSETAREIAERAFLDETWNKLAPHEQRTAIAAAGQKAGRQEEREWVMDQLHKHCCEENNCLVDMRTILWARLAAESNADET